MGAAAEVSVDDAGQADWQRIMGARIMKGSGLLTDIQALRNVVYVAVVSEPLDEFVRTFLEADVQGREGQSTQAQA